MDNKDQNLWLVRDTSNIIRGPYKHQEVLNLLKKKQLKNKTEISRANSYWFAVEEKPELARFFPELGLEVPPEEEKQTQMTATLTQADMNDREDITTFVASPKAAAETSPDPASASGAEWLSPEMADEFGDFDDFMVDASAKTGATEAEGLPLEKNTARAHEVSSEEMLKRATVKADTLPSERKDFQGSRPKPINTIMRGPERSAQASSNLVQVPIEKSDAHLNILPVETEEEAAAKRKKFSNAAVFAALVLGLAGLSYVLMPSRGGPAKNSSAMAGKKLSRPPLESLKRSLVLYDLEGAKESLSAMELNPDTKGKFVAPLGQAILKREFLFDSEGAVSGLLVAKSVIGDGEGRDEVANLIAVYGFEREPDESIDALRKLVQANPNQPIYKYNLATALLRAGKTAETLAVISPLLASLSESDPLFVEAAFTQGWAHELDPKSRELSEAAFLRALGADPTSGRARLGLAIHRLRRLGFRASEADFRAFIDLVPDLDPPARVINYRKMEAPEFYNAARGWIRELNLDGPMGSKPAPLIMAVDAMLSCLQNRTGEAGKILEGALSSSNGDFSVLKAMGYHRWKEGRYAEIVEIFRDIPKEKMGFAVPYILGKALVKLDRRAQADKIFEGLTQALPNRSEGWAQLGDSLYRDGKNAQAQPKLMNALRLDPRNLVALRAIESFGVPTNFFQDSLGNLPF